MSEALEQSDLREGYKEVQFGPKTLVVPTDWSIERFGDIFHRRRGSIDDLEDETIKYVGLKHLDSGQLTINGYDEDGRERSSSRVFHEGDVLFGKLRPNLNKAAIAPFSGICSSDIIPIYAEEGARQQYLPYLMHSKIVRDRAVSTMEGTNLPRTSWSDLAKTLIPLPPLPEQRRIADILSTVNNQIQQTDEIITEYKRLRKGVVQDLYDEKHSGGTSTLQKKSIDQILEERKQVWLESEKEKKNRSDENSDVDRSKYDPPLDLLFSSRLPDLPEGWQWVSLDTVVAYDIDYRGKTPPYSDSGIPVISSGNIQQGEITFSEERYVSPETYDEWLTRGVPKEGDLIVTTEAPVGKAAIYPEGKHLPTRRVIVLRTVGVDNRYLQAAINHPKVQSYLLAQSGGSTVGRILKDNLLRTPIPLPPKKQEKRLAAALNGIDQKIAEEQETRQQLQKLKRGLMQDLLTGKVRVDPDN